MRDFLRDFDKWFIVFFFVILPIIQAVFRKFAEAQKTMKERVEKLDDEPPPEWFDETAWEEVAEEESSPATSLPGTRPLDPAELDGPVIVSMPEPVPPRVRSVPPPPPRRPAAPSLLPGAESSFVSPHADDPFAISREPAKKAKPSVLMSGTDLQKAVVWSEILGKPRALRPHGEESQ